MPLFYTTYAFMTGSGFKIALGLFVLGTLFRVGGFLYSAHRKEKAYFAFYSPWFATRSMLAHTIPFVSHTTRDNRFTTLATTIFHLGFILVALFHSAHVVLIADALGFSANAWPMLPERLSHILAWCTAAGLLFLVARRIVNPAVRYITIGRDHVLNLALLLLLLSGIWARLQLPGHFPASVIHISAGNLLIAVAPFSRLAHLFMLPLTRGYVGSEFGGVRHVEDW